MSREDLAFEKYSSSNYLGEEEKRVRIFIEKLDEGLNYIKKNGCKNIVLDSHFLNKSKPILDLGFLYDLKNIESFSIGFLLSKKTDISPIYCLKNLIELQTIKNFIIDTSRFPKLKALFSENLSNEIEDYGELRSLTHLFFYPTTKDLKYLEKIENLQYIRMLNTKILSLYGIENLSNLKEIVIRGAPKLRDIEAASISKSLECLLIENAKELVDYSILADNNSIKKLNVSTVLSVDFIPRMKKIEHFSTSNIVDGNLRPLMESNTLLGIYIYPQKRHYSHKISELESYFESLDFSNS